MERFSELLKKLGGKVNIKVKKSDGTVTSVNGDTANLSPLDLSSSTGAGLNKDFSSSTVDLDGKNTHKKKMRAIKIFRI